MQFLNIKYNLLKIVRSHFVSTFLTIGILIVLVFSVGEMSAQPKTSASKWWQKPIRIMRRDYVNKFEKFINSDLSKLARENREVWHCNTEWVMGSLGCAPGLADITTFDAAGFDKLEKLGDRDVLREYIPIAHANGVRIISYLNMHWYSYEFAQKHPGWEQLVSTGESYGRVGPLYGNGTTMCVNSPWRDWAFKLIVETAKTGVDGIFLDGPVVFPGCCHCETCKRLFHEKTGAEIPEKEDWSNPLWKKFIAFREEFMVNFLSDAREALHSINPDAIIYLNGGKWHNDVARSPQQLEPYQDITGAEAFFHPGHRVHDLYASLITAKFLSAGRNPAMVFTHHALGSWHYIPLAPMEMKLAIAQTVAGGANPWFAVFDNSLQHSKEEAAAGVSEIQAFLEQNEEIFIAETSLARVALWASEQTSRYYVSRESIFFQEGGSGREENLIADVKKGNISIDWSKRKGKSADWIDADIKGFFNALSRAHIPLDFLWDSHITAERLKQYDVLILPNVACISKSQRHVIRKFAASGGTLIADFECGRFDELGEPIADPEWKKLLGLIEISGGFVPSVVEDYIRLVADDPMIAGLRKGQLVARPQFILKVEPKADSFIPAVVLEPIGMSYQELTSDSKYPAIITSQFAKGRVVYFPSLQGEFYYSRKIAQQQTLIANAILSAKRNRQKVTIEAPATVHFEVRSQDQEKSLHIHLVNNTGDMQRPLSEIIPLYNIKISINDVSKVTNARSLWLKQNLPVKMDGTKAFVTLPEIDVYDVVVIQLK